MQLRSSGLTDVGIIRPNNEDAFFIDEKHQVFAVADGLGGLPGGADASQRIVELLGVTMAQINAEDERVDLGELVIGIHNIVAKEGIEAHPFTGSGSTITIGQIVGNELLIAHVGDSAAYLLRDNKLSKLTTDHTMEQEWIKRMGKDQKTTMPPEYPHTLTRCVGQEAELIVDQNHTKLVPGDRLMFCTDGLNKVLSEQEIEKTFSRASDPNEACTDFLDCVIAMNAPDNVTLITVFID